jgi:hypothetical protein
MNAVSKSNALACSAIKAVRWGKSCADNFVYEVGVGAGLVGCSLALAQA